MTTTNEGGASAPGNVNVSRGDRYFIATGSRGYWYKDDTRSPYKQDHRAVRTISSSAMHLDVVGLVEDDDAINVRDVSVMPQGSPRLILDEHDVAAMVRVFKDISVKNRAVHRNYDAMHFAFEEGQRKEHGYGQSVPLMVPLHAFSSFLIIIISGLMASSYFTGAIYIHSFVGYIIIIFLFSLIAMDFVYQKQGGRGAGHR